MGEAHCQPVDIQRLGQALGSEAAVNHGHVHRIPPTVHQEQVEGAHGSSQEAGHDRQGELAIAQAVVYLACAPKSNAVYKAFKAAQADVAGAASDEVPLHLRNAPTRLAREENHGEDYRYAHDEPGAYAAGENYFPEAFRDRCYYEPTDRGLEQKIAEKLAYLRDLDKHSKMRRYE